MYELEEIVPFSWPFLLLSFVYVVLLFTPVNRSSFMLVLKTDAEVSRPYTSLL